MTPHLETTTQVRPAHVSHDSSKVHRAMVKHENAENSVSIRNNNNSLSSFTYSPVPTRMYVFTRARVYLGESWETCIRNWLSVCGSRLHTLPHVRTPCVAAPTFPTRHATQHVATRLRTCDLPLWQANRYLAKKSNEDWPAGTGTRLSRVCFAGPAWQGGV